MLIALAIAGIANRSAHGKGLKPSSTIYYRGEGTISAKAGQTIVVLPTFDNDGVYKRQSGPISTTGY